MEARDSLLGRRFDDHHAAGVTRYQVDRPHRDSGYYECVAVRGVEGTHHFIGSIQVFSRTEIVEALVAAFPDEEDDCREAQDNTPSLPGWRS